MQSKQLGADRLVRLSIGELMDLREELSIELGRIDAALVLRSAECDVESWTLGEVAA